MDDESAFGFSKETHDRLMKIHREHVESMERLRAQYNESVAKMELARLEWQWTRPTRGNT